jgi:hypothetical protein
MKRTVIGFGIVSMLAAGCAANVDQPGSTGSAQINQIEIPGIDTDQGRMLIGQPTSLEGADGKPVTFPQFHVGQLFLHGSSLSVRVRHGEIIGFLDGHSVYGRELEEALLVMFDGADGMAHGPARISAISGPVGRIDAQGRDNSNSTYLYYVEVRDRSKRWRPLCEPTQFAGDSYEIRHSAIAVDATWDARGDYHVTTSVRGPHPYFSLACLSGAIGKSYKWGWRPVGDTLEEIDINRERHQAGVRMARADYCGDGVPHTFTGTKVNVWDTTGGDPTPLDDDDKKFEAAWNSRGALCLSKLRWLSLGIDPACERIPPDRNPVCHDPARPGPFSNDNFGTLYPNVCDSAEEAAGYGALFNESGINGEKPPAQCPTK